MSRTSILRGPCKITYNSVVFMSKGDVTIKHLMGLTPVNTSRFGVIDWHVDSVQDVIEFEPDGRFLSAALATMLPFNTKTIGASVFGADTPLTINTVDGKQRVYVAAANTTKKQQIRLGIKQTMFGPMQFTCLYGGAVSPDDAGSLFADTNVSYPGDANYARSDVLTQAYDLAWDGAAAPWDAFVSKDGIMIDIDVDMTPETSESHGVYDYIFGGMQVSAKMEPDGPTALEAVTAALLQGTGATLGRSFSATSHHLNITGSGVYIRLYNAAPVLPNERFSAKLRRMGEIEFRASRTQTTGTIDPLFYVGTSAPA